MPLDLPPHHHRHPGDGWVTCGDHRHWGLHGAAGLFLVRRDRDADGSVRVAEIVLQHRAAWSHEGGTWGIPGGALAPGESAAAGALREAAEEAGIAPGAARLLGEHVLRHPVWTYTTVVAEAAVPVRPAPTDAESIAVHWVAVDDLAGLPLHPAFADALESLLAVASAA